MERHYLTYSDYGGTGPEEEIIKKRMPATSEDGKVIYIRYPNSNGDSGSTFRKSDRIEARYSCIEGDTLTCQGRFYSGNIIRKGSNTVSGIETYDLRYDAGDIRIWTGYWEVDGEERKQCQADDENKGFACCTPPMGTAACGTGGWEGADGGSGDDDGEVGDGALGSLNGCEGGTELLTLSVRPNFYRHTPLSKVVLPCRYDYECAGADAIQSDRLAPSLKPTGLPLASGSRRRLGESDNGAYSGSRRRWAALTIGNIHGFEQPAG